MTNYAIYPFVGLIEHGFEWVAHEREVAEVLELKLDDLVAGHSLKRLVRRGIAFKTDVYEVGGHMVWGATARILADLLSRVDGLRRPTASSPGATTSSGICHVSEPWRAIASPRPRARRRARRCPRSSPRTCAPDPRRARSPPISQHTIVTPCSASISVPIRSGSPT